MADNKKELSNIEFSKDAADYDQSKRYETLRESYPTIVAEALSSPFVAMLDIGCGTGALLSMIREKTTPCPTLRYRFIRGNDKGRQSEAWEGRRPASLRL